jgi:phosphoglycerate dehydrogenase-like enzyme
MVGAFNILYVGSVPPRIREELASQLPHGFHLTFLDDAVNKSTRNASLRQTDFLLGFPRDFGEEMAVMPQLKLVQLLSAGYDGFNVEAATRLGIPVANNGGANKVAVAEHTILLILALYKKLCQHHCALKRGTWLRENDHPLHLFELAGKDVGLIGFGNVGQALAARLRGFETHVSYFDVIRYPAAETALTAQYLPLNDLLTRSDVVSIHVPLSASTANLISKEKLRLMKPSAVLINTARGHIVDEAALYDALTTDTIAGAGLDVFAHENAIQRGEDASPLFTLDNVVITPHYAGHTYDTWLRRIEIGYQNIVHAATGEPPLYVVNPDVVRPQENRPRT